MNKIHDDQSQNDNNELNSRVQREIESYQDGLQRERFNDILSHCGYYSDKRRLEIIRNTIEPANNGKVLEFGCMIWHLWIDKNNLNPKTIECINISERELEEGRKIAASSKLKPNFQIMDAHNLSFEPHSFDAVFGGAILHHLEFARALEQVKLALKPDGSMVFIEPLRLNPIAMIVRLLTPKARTEDEKPLGYEELNLLKENFDLELHFEQLFAVPVGIISRLIFSTPENWLNKAAFIFDSWLVKVFPQLGPFYRSIIITGKNIKNKQTI